MEPDKAFVIRCVKDVLFGPQELSSSFQMEGTMHIPATSKRKAKKLFKEKYKGWKIVEIKIRGANE